MTASHRHWPNPADAEGRRDESVTVEQQLDRIAFRHGVKALDRCEWASDDQKLAAARKLRAMTQGSDRWFTGPAISI